MGDKWIKQIISPDIILEKIRRIWKQLAIRREGSGGGKPENDGTSEVTTTTTQAEDKLVEELSSKVKYSREMMYYFNDGIIVLHVFPTSTWCEDENMKYYVKYLTELQEFLKSVPESLHKTKEYKDGVDLSKQGSDRYADVLKYRNGV